MSNMNPKAVFAICLVAVIYATPTLHAERATVVHNKPYNLTCNYRCNSGGNGPIFIWRKNGENLAEEDQHFKVYNSMEGSTLKVVPLLRHSNTGVSCQVIVVGEAGTDCFQNWTLSVEREPPRIITPPDGATFLEGAASTLNCTSIYDVNITWSVGGKPFGEVVLLNSTADGGTVSLVEFVAQRSQHHRELKCVIPSAVEGATEPPPASEVVLSIVYPPSITAGRIKGNLATFWCESDANPAANISWIGPPDSENATELIRWTEEGDTGINRIRSELMVDPEFATGAGGYTCSASNAYGNSSAMISLEYADKHLPLIIGVPVGVFSFGVVCIVLVFMVLMKWKPGGQLLIKWRPGEVMPSEPIYDTTLPEGSLGLTRRLSTFVTGTWKRGSWFGSAQRSTMDLEMMNRSRLTIKKAVE